MLQDMKYGARAQRRPPAPLKGGSISNMNELFLNNENESLLSWIVGQKEEIKRSIVIRPLI